MSAGRFEMPNGMTLRTNTKRRYIVAVYIGGEARWRIEHRSDKESVALARWHEECRQGTIANVIDTIDRKVIR